ncbi:IS4 family transposase [Neptuniibacter sp.]|uniref:IS4 family transposase n=1 Tax=Neptuniibacter sp. TaxID=1962643 RepID=UPI003B59292B
MLLHQTLLDIDDLHQFSDQSTFTQNIPVEWIESALTLTQSATIRRRRLPTDQVLWLVLGMSLFRDEPIADVARRLNICSQGLANESLLAKSGISTARQRLGSQPLEWLFRKTGSHWGRERYPHDDWNGLQVLAVDGALFRTPDTPELREHFGSGNTSSNRQTPYPVMRLVGLMNTRSHIMLDAQISPYRKGEIRMAESFIARIPDHSVTLLDKGFWGADLLLNIGFNGDNRHWLIPARKGLVYEEVERYNPQDKLLQMKVSAQARKRNPNLPETWEVRAVTYDINGIEKTVYTSLPYAQYDTEMVAELYHERWEIELGFRDIKSSMNNNALTLRSKKVELIYQEAWSLLLAYNVVRREAGQAAIAYQRLPGEMSFKAAYCYIASQLIVMAQAQPISKTGTRLSHLRSGIGELCVNYRPRPSRPRTVKMSKTRYPVNRHAAPLK